MRFKALWLGIACQLMAWAQQVSGTLEHPFRVAPGKPVLLKVHALNSTRPPIVKVNIFLELAEPARSCFFSLFQGGPRWHPPAGHGEMQGLQSLEGSVLFSSPVPGLQREPRVEGLGLAGVEVEGRQLLRSESPVPRELGREPVEGRGFIQSWELSLKSLEPGCYALDVEINGSLCRVPCLVSDLLVHLEGHGVEFEARVLRASDGTERRRATLLLDYEGKGLKPWPADAHGRHTLKLEEARSVRILALEGKEAAFANFWGLGPMPYDPGGRFRSLLAYTDRPVYQPGQQVFFRALAHPEAEWKPESLDSPYWVLGDLNNLDLKVPGPRALRVHLWGPAFREEIPTSALLLDPATRSFAGSARLPLNAAPGTYTLEFQNQQFYEKVPFEVRKYEKPRFSVSFEAAPFAEDRIRHQVAARAFTGAPVPHGKVAWHLFALRQDERVPWWSSQRTRPIPLGSGEGRTDAQGRYLLDLVAPDPGEAKSFRLLVEVTDAGGQRQSVSRVFGEDGDANEAVDLRLNRWVLKEGESLEAEALGASTVRFQVYRAMPAEGQQAFWQPTRPWRAGAKVFEAQGPKASCKLASGAFLLEVSGRLATGEGFLLRRPVLVAGGGLPVTSQLRLVSEGLSLHPKPSIRVLALLPKAPLNLRWTLSSQGQVRRGEMFMASRAGFLEIPLPQVFPKGGWLHVEALLGDQHHQARLPIDPAGDQHRLQLSIRADRQEPRPGEKVHLLVSATDAQGRPQRATTSLAVVDEALFAMEPERLPDPVAFLSRLPVDQSWSLIFGEGQGSSGWLDLSPLVVDSQADLGELPIGPKGTQATLGALSGRVTSRAGMPLEGVSVEAISSSVPGVHRTKSDEDGRWRMQLPPGLYSVTFSKVGMQSTRRTDLKLCEGGLLSFNAVLGNESGAAAAVEVLATDGLPQDTLPEGISMVPAMAQRALAALRGHFLDVALWDPDLRVEGEAHAELPLPEDLTAWRITALGITPDGLAGIGRLRLSVKKPLQVNLVVPEVLTEGDETQAVLLVQNRDTKSLAGQAVLAVEGGATRSAPFQLKPESEVRLTFPVQAPKGLDRLVLKAGAIAGQEQDGEKRELQVISPRVSARIQQAVVLTGGQGRLSLLVPDWADQKGSLDLYGLNGGLEQLVAKGLTTLIRYPYGCVEQTLSSFMPNLLLAQLVKEGRMPPLEAQDLERLDAMIAQGVDRVLAFQLPGGGWGWYGPDDFQGKPSPHTTGYAVASLSLMKRLGYPLDPARYQQGLRAARGLVQDLSSMEAGMSEGQAYSLRGDLAYLLAALAQADGERSPALDGAVESVLKGRWTGGTLLALVTEAAVRTRHSRGKDLLDALEAVAQHREGMVCWTEGKGFSHGYLQGDVQSTIAALRALCHGRPGSKLLEPAEAFLLSRFDGAGWNSTWHTAQVVSLLTDLARTRPLTWKGVPMTVKVDGGRPLSLEEAPLRLPVTAGQKLNIQAEGRGVLLAVLGAESARPMASPASGELRLDLQRRLSRLSLASQGGWQSSPLEKSLKVGDEVLMELRLESNRYLWYGLVEVPVPAGFEAIPLLDGLKLDGVDMGAEMLHCRSEAYPDRLAFMFHAIPAKRPESLWVRLRARVEGRYTLRPAVFRLMSEDSAWSSTESTELSIVPEGGSR